ncbi:MAG: DNA-packaging protein [Rhodomicrobium sp.]|nr:MAG: DNA-packaging protein [Rhodomicrobium sp.]
MRTKSAARLRLALKNSSKDYEFDKNLKSLPIETLAALEHDWQIWARDDQLPPPLEEEAPWHIWLLLGGRGAGKTRAGAEWIRAMALGLAPITEEPARRIALVGETLGDVRRTMIEGESGLLAIHPANERPLFEPSRRRLTWPNGSMAEMFSAEDPEGLRGPQFMAAWCDELAKWPNANETWDMLQFALRLGCAPRQVVTTTPRPTKLIKRLLKDEGTRIGRASTMDNAAHLSKGFMKNITSRYEGTRLGRQELAGELLQDRQDALWQRDALEAMRCSAAPELCRIIIAIDPPMTGSAKADLCGLIAAGLGADGRAYILADRSTQGLAPLKWAEAAIRLYHHYEADRLVAEVNQGGDLVETVLRQVDDTIAVTKVHAKRGKWLRAEPVAALYEQGRVAHVGPLPELEDQMCDFGPEGLSNGRSPDRVDALVWAVTDLLLKKTANPRLRRPI